MIGQDAVEFTIHSLNFFLIGVPVALFITAAADMIRALLK